MTCTRSDVSPPSCYLVRAAIWLWASGVVLGCNSSSHGGPPDQDSSTPDAAVGRTSCGALPILGDYWKATPSECGTCADQTCCAEATACAANAECVAYRDCLLSCTSKLDFGCVFACRSQHSHQLSDAFDSCIVGGCSSCVDISCRDQAWTSPTTSQGSQDLYINDFVS